MKNYFIRLSNQHETISKYILIFVTIILIVIALPKETQFNYTFQKGKPWAFDNLLAPFDFAINKTESELNEEKASIMKNTHPFYRFDLQTAQEKENTFKNELSEVWNGRRLSSSRKDMDSFLKQKQRQQLAAGAVEAEPEPDPATQRRQN